MAEMQNDPKPPADCRRGGVERGRNPQQGERPAARRSAQGLRVPYRFYRRTRRLLFWAVCGWESDFTGYGIEYGSFPEQSKRYYTLATAQPTLQQQFSGGGKESPSLQGSNTSQPTCWPGTTRATTAAPSRSAGC